MKKILHLAVRSVYILRVVFMRFIRAVVRFLSPSNRTMLWMYVAVAALVCVPAFFFEPWSPLVLKMSLIRSARMHDAWTPVLFARGGDAVAEALEDKAHPQDAGNDFKTARFTYMHVTSTTTREVAADVPVTGEPKADEALVRFTEAFLDTVAQKTRAASFTADARSFKEYLFVTLSGPKDIEYKTIVVTKDGMFDQSKLFGSGYEEVVLDNATTTLVSRFPGLQREDASRAIQKALESKAVRVATNGLVVSVPMRELPAANAGVPYHEVLVPMSVIGQYIKTN